jgi:radical SAM protein with 4Fe4S-binding SPASM domain
MNFARNLTKGLQALATRRLSIQSDAIPYRFKGVALKKMLNACLVETSLYFKPSYPWGMPTHLQVEPSTRCNLRCTLCPVPRGLKRPQGLMDPEIFRKIIDQTGDFIFTLLLWDWGEPFLNPAIFEMIDYARQKDLRIACSTNGHLFADPAHAERVVGTKLDTLIFAVDGLTQQSYALYRQGGSLDRVFLGIRNVVSQKRKMGSTTPLVNFRFIVMRQNEHEIPLLRQTCRDLGVDVLTLKTLNHCLRDPYPDQARVDREEEMLPREARYRRFRSSGSGAGAIRRKHNPCKQFWNNPCLHWDGSVVPCTFDPEDRFKLGDLKRQSFREVWYGENYRALRREFRQNWGKMELCGECSYAYEGGSLNCETMAETLVLNRSESHGLEGTVDGSIVRPA